MQAVRKYYFHILLILVLHHEVQCLETLPVGEKARRACKYFEKLGYKKTESSSLLMTDETIEEICPWDNGIQRQFDNTVKTGEFPHMAAIGYGTLNNYSSFCLGSLISEKFVLTAAHCLYSRAHGSAEAVLVGFQDFRNLEERKHGQQIKIKKRHKHPDYKLPEYYNDLALFELERPVNLSVYVKPACLYRNDSVDIQKGIIIGRALYEGYTYDENITKDVVEVVTPEKCKEPYSFSLRQLPRGIDTNRQICYTSKCVISSGGPLMIYADDVYCSHYVFGIASFGKSCGLERVPDVYVKLYPYIEWIESIVWA